MILYFHMHSGATVSVLRVKEYNITTGPAPTSVREFEITYKDGTMLGKEPQALPSTIDLTRVEAVSVEAEEDDEE
jgi:hypothetical protein